MQCPDCEIYVSPGRTCKKCGWKAEKIAAPQAGASSYQECAWSTRGDRCTMPATIYPHPAGPGAKGLCSWHWEVKFHGWDNTFPEFMRFLKMEDDWNACSNWTHYDAEPLWKWTQGERSHGDEHPCRRGGCIVIAEQDKKKEPLPRLTPAETAVKLREIERILDKSALMAKVKPVSAVELAAANEGW